MDPNNEAAHPVSRAIWDIVKDDPAVESLNGRLGEYQIITNVDVGVGRWDHWARMVDAVRAATPHDTPFSIFKRGNPHHAELDVLFTKV